MAFILGTLEGHWARELGTTVAATDTVGPRNVVVAGNGEGAAHLPDLLRREGHSVVSIQDGWAALDHFRRCPADVALLHQTLSGLDGTDLCRLLKRDQSTRLLPVILFLPESASLEDRLDGIEAGADEVVPAPIDLRLLMARMRALVRLKRYTNDFEQAASVMTTLATMIEARNRYSEGHCHRMANYAAALGRRIGFEGEDLHVLRRGGFLHDIGMLAIPDAVLLKPGALDADERALIRSHTVIGDSIIANLRSLQSVRGIVRHHHERRDGSGYPDALRGDEIPLSAQIVGLVDIYEALTSPRPYQRTVSPTEALAVLRRQGESGWHRQDLVDEFAHIINAA
jgi:putative two-component system response regulator